MSVRTTLNYKRGDLNFPIVNFFLYIVTFQLQHLHMEYISLNWYDIPLLVFPIRIILIEGLLLTSKLLNQGFQIVKIKSSLWKFHGRHHIARNHGWFSSWIFINQIASCNDVSKETLNHAYLEDTDENSYLFFLNNISSQFWSH